jgi:hypothetical protein
MQVSKLRKSLSLTGNRGLAKKSDASNERVIEFTV